MVQLCHMTAVVKGQKHFLRTQTHHSPKIKWWMFYKHLCRQANQDIPLGENWSCLKLQSNDYNHVTGQLCFTMCLAVWVLLSQTSSGFWSTLHSLSPPSTLGPITRLLMTPRKRLHLLFWSNSAGSQLKNSVKSHRVKTSRENPNIWQYRSSLGRTTGSSLEDLHKPGIKQLNTTLLCE